MLKPPVSGWPSLSDATLHWREDPEGQLIGDGIARFRDPAHAGEPLAPSLALLSDPPALAPVPPPSFQNFKNRPKFADHAGERVICVPVEPGTSLYGTGEVAGPLLRNGHSASLWNTDAFEYNDATPALYQSHPWVLAVRADGSAFGVLADTTHRCEIDLRGGQIGFRVVGPPCQVIIIDRPSPQGVLAGLAELTGRMAMPARWALGYQQCRWSYEPEERVRQLAGEFRARGVPCDVLWLDIDYMHGFRCFTFDAAKFPGPRKLTEDLRALGFRSVWMIDPGIKVDPGYAVYESGRAGGHFVRARDGSEYHGDVWPGKCAFPDFTRARTRRWWADLYAEFMATGLDGVWNDMNEPSVFDGPGRTMPLDAVHRADPALGGHGPHARYHNVYGMLMARATREGMLRAHPARRPFVLTRSNYLGGHRYAATWTGDNLSTWTHLHWSITMTLNLGLSGQPFAGPDIGGFQGNADAPLFARWMGIGALLPFARAHSIKESTDHEPWSFGVEAERTCRLALERRYRLLPYLYTLFREASLTGLPVARPVFFADPADPALRDVDDSFLLGSDLLVRARVLEHGLSTSPTPAGIWLPVEPAATTDPELPALLLRGGSILPLGPVMQFSDERPLDPLTLIVALDESGEAIGRLYEDAGDGHEHLQGAYLLTTYRAVRRTDSEGQDGVEVSVAATEGRFARPDRAVEVHVLLPDGTVRRASGRDGQTVRVDLG